jgi:DNA adenine methylase
MLTQLESLLQAFVHAELRNTIEAVALSSTTEARAVWRAVKNGALMPLRTAQVSLDVKPRLQAAGIALYSILDRQSASRFGKVATLYENATTLGEQEACAGRLVSIAERGLFSSRKPSPGSAQLLQEVVRLLSPPFSWTGFDVRKKTWARAAARPFTFYLVDEADADQVPARIVAPAVIGVLPRKKPTRAYFKWPGGKSRLTPVLLPILQLDSADLYVEPFFGGGSVFFKAAFPGPAFLSDVNPRIIALHQAVQRDPLAVHQAVERLPWGTTWKEHYLERRRAFNATTPEPTPVFAADMLWLAAGAYNGLWRENASGGMNAPPGLYDEIRPPPPERLWAAAQALQNATLLCHDFRQILLAVARLDASIRVSIYADPPYVPISASASFTGYSAGGFNEKDQFDLAHALAYLARRPNVRIVTSNADMPVVRELYGGLDFDLHEVQVRRSIAAQGSSRGLANELIATAGQHR